MTQNITKDIRSPETLGRQQSLLTEYHELRKEERDTWKKDAQKYKDHRLSEGHNQDYIDSLLREEFRNRIVEIERELIQIRIEVLEYMKNLVSTN